MVNFFISSFCHINIKHGVFALMGVIFSCFPFIWESSFKAVYSIILETRKAEECAVRMPGNDRNIPDIDV